MAEDNTLQGGERGMIELWLKIIMMAFVVLVPTAFLVGCFLRLCIWVVDRFLDDAELSDSKNE